MRRIGGVERQEDRAGAQSREIDENIRGRFLHLDGNAVARLYAERGQGVSVTRAGREHLPVSNRQAFRRLDQDLFRIGDFRHDEIEKVIHAMLPPPE